MKDQNETLLQEAEKQRKKIKELASELASVEAKLQSTNAAKK